MIKYKYDLHNAEFLLIDVAGKKREENNSNGLLLSYPENMKKGYQYQKKENRFTSLLRANIMPQDYRQYIKELPSNSHLP